MKMPIFLRWTVIPAGVLARAWTDDQFKQDFLLSPNQALREIGMRAPDAVRFCVLENTPHERFLVLPHKSPKTYGWSREKVLQRLLEETGSDESLEYWLPAEMMVEAYFNPAFKKRLYTDIHNVLREWDCAVEEGCTYTVVENTEHIYHLIVPVNKWVDRSLEAEELEYLIIEDFLNFQVVH